MLIKAALHRDDGVALASARYWLAEHNIEQVDYLDHRLLVVVINRFGRELAGDPAHARLTGLRKKQWTHSRLVLSEAQPSLHRLEQAGIDLMLINGAEDSVVGSARHNIELLMRRDQSVRAFDMLLADGWATDRWESDLYLREHIASVRRVNMWRGLYGDIVFHTRPFGPGQGGDLDDLDIWRRAKPANLEGGRCLVPTAEDRLALALCLNVTEDPTQNDWLTNSASLVMRHPMNWGAFEEIIARRGLAVAAVMTLGYLVDELGHEVPDDALVRLNRQAHTSRLSYLTKSILMQPSDRSTAIGRFAKVVLRRIQRRDEKRQSRQVRHRPDRYLTVRSIGPRMIGLRESLSPVIRHEFSIPVGPRVDRLHLRAVLHITVPRGRRRVELEINGSRSHVCRIRFRKLTKVRRALRLEIKGIVEVPTGETALILESRPLHCARGFGEASCAASDRAIPFDLVSLAVDPIAGSQLPVERQA